MNNYLFEISWEVCNKVGGIYTVITSKIEYLEKHIKNYYFLGSYYAANKEEFSKEETPKEFEEQVKKLEEIGIKLHFGKWLVNGYPKVILVEYMNYSHNINNIKTKLWEKYSIDSLNTSWHDYDEVILWSYCCGIAIEYLTKNINEPILTHSHEWMAGGAILHLKSLQENKHKCIFTTHATMLGRAMSGSGRNIYQEMETIDADKECYNIGVNTKHQTEKALALNANCFTTVSDITNNEAKKFYGKSADILLYNGFSNKTESIEELNVDFEKSRNDINKFLEDYFYTSTKINTQNTYIFYTSGRNEFKNKGVDLYIKSLGLLNEKLKAENSSKTIVSLFLIPIGNFDIDERVLESFNASARQTKPEESVPYAPLSTHKVPIDNEIISSLFNNKLLNHQSNKVKVILIPTYLSEKDSILKKNYYDTIIGTDLGIFPSYYEPWGYTPLESISFAVPTVTSDLAGFGIYVNSCCKEKKSIKVLQRKEKTYNESEQELYEYLYEFVNQTQKEMSLTKDEAKLISRHFDWEYFIQNYLKAYEIAKEK